MRPMVNYMVENILHYDGYLSVVVLTPTSVPSFFRDKGTVSIDAPDDVYRPLFVVPNLFPSHPPILICRHIKI